MWKIRKADTGKVYATPDLRSLQGWCRDGRVVEPDMVSSDEDPTWRPAGSVFDLAAHFQSVHQGRTTAAAAAVPVVEVAAGPTAGAARAARRPGRRPARRPRGDSDADSIDPDLTSMMDMAFILVILLMVISTPAFQHGMPVNVPESKTTGKIDATDVQVTIDKDGNIAVNEKRLHDASELKEELESRITDIKSGQAKLILRADAEVTHGRVVEVMDVIRGDCQIKDISIATKPKPKGT